MFKKIMRACFRFLLWAAYKSYKLEGVNALLLILPSKMMVPTLRKYGAEIGEDTVIHSPLIIHNAGNNYSNLRIGHNSYFGRAVFLDLKEKITIGNRVTVSMRSILLTHTDVGESKTRKVIRPSAAAIKIGDDAYVGANVTILEGVQIGAAAVIGACSLVLEDVASEKVVAGVPAKEIKRDHE